MRMIVRAALAAAVLGGAACAAPRAEAAVIVTVVQSGGNVVMTASGSINLAGLSGPTNIGNPYGSVTIYPNNSVGLSVGTASASVDEYTTTFTTSTAPYPFISQQSTLLTSTFNSPLTKSAWVDSLSS